MKLYIYYGTINTHTILMGLAIISPRSARLFPRSVKSPAVERVRLGDPAFFLARSISPPLSLSCLSLRTEDRCHSLSDSSDSLSAPRRQRLELTRVKRDDAVCIINRKNDTLRASLCAM